MVEGDGVRLRALRATDVPRIVEGLGDPDTQPWLEFMPRDPGEAEGWAYLETAQERLATAHTLTWGFSATDDDLLLGVERLAGHAAADNAASLRVLEANGLRRIGVQRHAARTGDGSIDLVGYDALAGEWASPRR